MSVCSPPLHAHLPNAVVSSSASEGRVPLHCLQSPNPHSELTNSLKLVASHHLPSRNRRFHLNCAGSETASVAGKNGDFTEVKAMVFEPKIDGGDGGDSFGGGGRGEGDGGGKEDGGEEEEFGPLLKFDEVMKESEARGMKLPLDMVEAAKTTRLREVFLLRYLDLQGSVWPLGFLMKYCSMLRNRMMADPSFLFKVGTEIVIDSCCATFAEVQKRGKDFWAEFELYAADLLVGIVVDIALVGMLAPYARIGKPLVSQGLLGSVQKACAALPSSVFEAERPGCKFTVKQRTATYFYKGVLYGSVGFVCGLIGQGIANMIMNAKRSVKKSEGDIPVPPLVKSAALWGVFLAVSSNTRYQIVNGLEGLVEASPLAKRVPPVAMAFTIGVRFANNIYGGMQFVDWAKLSGVQ
ncbi:LOW QUALITY PROTEIN: protein RETICULATA-RELATED 1, chloroplastic-like [Pyrus x bretschneideri]|uniref:LOW QUALITY PROTEIN: protein RETICULATA-RELATED 1, chloroplastic-like n=1 Tax=Pyrus x bretschneideri TaxID=225117 RepID=UPI0020307430|nr:LOW QUALITY PROTEIN: protein RETICULATA-RELATED 1, chloroplastic-like [Pyrus x bretschneideri]